MNTLLDYKNVSIGYENKIIANSISFTINKGDYICIIGENGAGKSTLMKTILGLIKPINGDININFNKNSIGYLPQSDDYQKQFPASVMEIVLSGCLNNKFKPFYTKQDKELALKNLSVVEMTEYKNRSFNKLSGGQQQRVLLARALCAAKEIILLDEPVTGLDPKHQAQMYDFIQKLNNNGMTVIMISHDINAVKKYASHILEVTVTGSKFYKNKEDK